MKKIVLALLLFTLTACGSVPALIVEPTASPTPQPTNTPLPPTATPTSTPFPTGPCDNPLVPLAAGNQWTYRVTTSNGESLYILKTVEIRNEANIIALVDFTDQKNNNVVHEWVVCQNGVIENFPLFVTAMLLSDFVRSTFNTYHDKGIYAPSHQMLLDNDWQMLWVAEYQTEDRTYLKNPMGGSDISIVEASPMHLSFQTDGEQDLLMTPVGEFPQAIKVLQTLSTSVTITLPSGGTSGTLDFEAMHWYAPYVGLVHAQMDTASLRTQGTTLPVQIGSVLELVEFRPGN